MQASPRGAAALLRVALEKLCNVLEGKDRKLDEHIAKLVAKGLDTRIQRALDIVRVVGNGAVHAGQLDVRDDPETVGILFFVINYVAERRISEPKRIDDFFRETVPQTEKARIAKRNRPPVT